MSVDETMVDVDVWVGRVRHLAGFVASSATLDDLDAVAPEISALAGWVALLRSACATRRGVLADQAVEAGLGSPDHGDPQAGHGRSHRRSRKASAKDLERDVTLRAFPAVREVLLAGSIGVEHVDIVTAVLRDLTVQQQLTVRDQGSAIASLATVHGPERFRVALRQLLWRLIEEDGVRRLERRRRNTRLSVWTDADSGMVKVYGEFDPERGTIITNRLQAALDAMYALPTPPGCPDDPTDKNNHLRALALLSLLQTAGGDLFGPSDGGPDVATIDMVLVVDHDTLCRGVHEHSIIDAGPGIELPVETLRRLACCANIIPAVLGSNGVLLDQGREARLANRRQRRALRAMYPACAITGCATRFDHCKIHHIAWWDRDHGPTDLSNLLPLCSKHHYLVHEGGWLLSIEPTTRVLTVRFPDGTSTTMPPPRQGWNGNAASAPHHGDGTPRDISAGAEPEPDPPPDAPPDLTLWAS